MLDRKIRKKIEWAFYNYKELKAAAEEYIIDFAERQMAVDYEKLPIKTSGNGVESSLIKAIDKGGAYRWCKIVEQTLEHFAGTGKDTLVRLKYFDKLREWRLCERLFISRSSLFEWVNDVLAHSAILAAQFGLIKVL